MASITTAADAGKLCLHHTIKDQFANVHYKVARIAYQASDVVLSVQPSLRTDSLFSKSLKALKANKTASAISRGTPEVGAPLHSETIDGPFS
jgi:hypothetical protein